MNKLNIDLNFILEKLNSNLELFKNSNIFITGGTGFFGKWLLETINEINKSLNYNINVTVLSRSPSEFKKNYPHLSSFSFITGDVRNFKFPSQNFDFIIHAATEASHELNVNNPKLMFDTIESGTKRILKFASNSKCKKLLFTSSGAIYGKRMASTSPILENDYQNNDSNLLNDAYADGKRIAENLFLQFGKNSETDVTIARCFAFVGPYLPLDTHFAIGNFISSKLNNKDILMTGDGSPYRSYMYSSDLVIWLLTILLKGQNNEIYNVGSDQKITIKNLANKIENKQIDTDKINSNSHWYVPDISKAKRDLGLKIYTDLDSAILKTISYHQSK